MIIHKIVFRGSDIVAEYLGLTFDGRMSIAPEEDRFTQFYTKNWAEILATTYYKSETVDWGHRLRPRLVYWGFLAGSTLPLSDEQLDTVAKVAVCIELVHKSSLILDDYIDRDTMRHGLPSFYVTHGVEKTIMYTIHLLCVSLQTLTSVYFSHSIDGYYYYKSLTALISTLYNMSLGVLKELDLTCDNLSDIQQVKEIMDLETSSLIRNSLLLGYFLSEKIDKNIEAAFERIGTKLGYAFQVLNDLEPFCNMKSEAHKGSINTDVSRGRKNICFSVIFELSSNQEKRQIATTDDALLEQLFKKYNIQKIMIDEIHNVLLNIENELSELRPKIRCDEWTDEFLQFIKSVFTTFENRLN